MFENYPVGGGEDAEREAGLRLTRIRAWERTNYPLTLVVAPGRRLRLRMSYQEERFANAAVEQLLDQLERALLGLAGPGSVGDVDILGASERERLLALGRGAGRQAAPTSTTLPYRVGSTAISRLPAG